MNTPNNSWEEELKNQLIELTNSCGYDFSKQHNNNFIAGEKKIQEFIRSEITKARQDTVKEVIEKLERECQAWKNLDPKKHSIAASAFEYLSNQLRNEYKIE